MKVGNAAVIAADFHIEFAAGAVRKPFSLGSCVSIRVGQPPNIDKCYLVAAKPIDFKTKTCTSDQGWPLLAGFIPMDQSTFGRENSAPLPEDCESVHFQISIHELLHDLSLKKYEIISLRDGYLEFKSVSNDVVFRIKLEGGGNPPLITLNSSGEFRPWNEQAPMPEPDFWQEAFKEYDPMALYQVEYKKPYSNEFNPLMVASINGNPITGDVDLLSIVVPLEVARGGYCKAYNTAKESEVVELVEHFIALLYKINHEQITLSQFRELNHEVTKFAETSGVITPLELLTTFAINDAFKKSASISVILLLHGPETNNPGKPSDLNCRVLHFYKGLPVLTESENELVGFYLQPGMIEKHFVPVHPLWNMEKWAPVIKKQLACGQEDLINPKTLEAYHRFNREIEYMSRAAPVISQLLYEGYMHRVSKEQLELYDRYMKYEDSLPQFEKDIASVIKKMSDGDMEHAQYFHNGNEFSLIHDSRSGTPVPIDPESLIYESRPGTPAPDEPEVIKLCY